jgi:hypothetical protein
MMIFHVGESFLVNLSVHGATGKFFVVAGL